MRARRTARVALEPLEPRHADELFEGLQDERLYRWIPEQRPESIESLRRRYEKLHLRRSPDGTELWLNWAIRALNETRYVGYVQATVRGNKALIAYVFFTDAWGKGFAFEAVVAMIMELREQYHVSEVCATVDQRNERSIRLLTKLGFKQVRINAPADGDEIVFRDGDDD
jgi:[ribosomal protein S5]-alanine N-acetyltransferase